MTDKGAIYDPLRKRLVPRTPEEEVRQWFISVLGKEAGVPLHMMMSEVAMSVVTPSGTKPYRADILVYSRQGNPLMVVECKRPSVKLSGATAQQALRYATILGVRYVALTNGTVSRMFELRGGKSTGLDTLPDYDAMNLV